MTYPVYQFAKHTASMYSGYMEYRLPRKYLSYSAYSLWKKSKDMYRRRYYLNEKPFQTAETVFGNKIGKILEDEEHRDDPILSNIIDYPKKEHRIDVHYEGLHIMGYLDQFHDEEYRIMEMKTGHKDKNGKVPWDDLKVRKHKQLDFYSVLVEQKYGKVCDEVILQWLETDIKEKGVLYNGRFYIQDKRHIELTGEIYTFKRIIEPWQRDVMLQDILLVAEEITEDYTQWLKTNQQKKK